MAQVKSSARLKKKTILVCLSGSIALYKSCDLIRELRREGADCHCLMTRSAQQFVTPLTFQALSGHKVYADQFSTEQDWSVLHTQLADQADLILVSPASANIIARLANGMADDLVASVILASKAKVLIVPAMNDNMFAHSLTQENIRKLRQIGYQFTDPIEGDLVCGRVGVGHIADQSTILTKVFSLISSKK